MIANDHDSQVLAARMKRNHIKLIAYCGWTCDHFVSVSRCRTKPGFSFFLVQDSAWILMLSTMVVQIWYCSTKYLLLLLGFLFSFPFLLLPVDIIACWGEGYACKATAERTRYYRSSAYMDGREQNKTAIRVEAWQGGEEEDMVGDLCGARECMFCSRLAPPVCHVCWKRCTRGMWWDTLVLTYSWWRIPRATHFHQWCTHSWAADWLHLDDEEAVHLPHHSHWSVRKEDDAKLDDRAPICGLQINACGTSGGYEWLYPSFL